ncbi:MAG: isopeptide-forming domain-containing fimbrial protein [Pseudoxanthomonas sp.]
MRSNNFRQARVAIVGGVLALVAGLAGLTAQPAYAQAATVTNVATVAPPAGVIDTDTANNSSQATVTITAAAGYSFCATPPGTATSNAIYSLVNGARIARYEPGAGNDANVTELATPTTVGGDLNALMIDPVQDRLLFHAAAGQQLWAYDADNGGWYVAATGVSGNFPRGGFNASGIGYLMEGGTSPAVRRITPSGPSNYTVASAGNLTFDFTPNGSNTSGDIAFDGNGNMWLLVGRDLYLVSAASLAANAPVAVRQTRPLIGGVVPTIDFAGIAFASDGTLYLATNAAPSAYYAYDPATGELTQTATTAANGSRDLASCGFPTPAEPDLSVVKSLAQVNGAVYVAGAAVSAGDTLTYAITISNSGGAVGTLFPNDIVEAVPANTTYVATGNDFSATASPGPGYTLGAAINVPAGDDVTLNFVVTVNDPVPAGVTSIANAVTFPNGTIDCDASGNDCNETTPVGPGIVTTKTSSPASGSNVIPGQTITYTLTVVVSNAATTAPLILTDTLGANLTFGAVTDAGGFACNAASPLVCTLPANSPTGSYVVTYTATVDAGAAAGTTVNNSVATDPTNNGGDGSPSCPTATPCTTEHHVVDAPNLTVAKTGPAAAVVGEAYDYVITVTNDGGAATTTVATITDTVPAGLTINSATGCTISGQTVTCPVAAGLSNVAPNNTASFTINVTPQASTSGTTLTNIANVNGGGDPGCTAVGDCPSPPVTTEVGAPNLEIAKTGPANAVVGVAYDYTITVTNSGTAATTAAATVTDAVPAGLTINSATGCTISGQTVTCPVAAGLSNVAPNNTASFTINVTPQASTSGTTLTNIANVNGGGDPGCTAVGDCPSPPVTTEVGAPNLEIAKTGPANAVVGVAYDYTITVTNSGTAATTAAATVTDAVPAGLTINSATGCTISGQTVTCPVAAGLSNVAPNNTASFTINVTPQASTSGTTLTNIANVNGGGDPDCTAVGDCPSPPVTTEVGAPNLEIAKTGPANAVVGVAYDYTITVTNSGTAATTAAATVTDAVPAGLTINTATGCTIAGQTVTCAVPTGLAVGASTSFTISVTPQASTSGTTLTNIANVNGGGDPDCTAVGDCPSPPVTTEIAKPVVTFNKSSSPASGADVEIGDIITYTLSVTVADAPTLSDVVLVDIVGAGLGDIAVTNLGVFTGGFAGSTGTFTLATGTAPGTYAVQYTATVQANAGTTVGNSVTASGGNPPPGPGVPPTDPTCDGACTTEHNVVKPAVTVAKSANPAAGTEVAVGDTLTYTLTTTVANASLLSDVVLTDTLGAGLSFGAVTNAGAFACTGTLTCTLPAGTAPGTYAVTYTATVDVSAAISVRNSVEATGGNLPPNPGEPPTEPTCSVCETEHNVAAPAITVAKSSNPGSGTEVRAGDTIAYTLTVTVENSATTDVLTLADTLGAGLSFGAVTDAGAFACTGSLNCTLPVGTPVGSYALTYTATVDASATGTLRNSVVPSVPPGGNTPDPTCDVCDTSHELVDPRVTVNKSANPASGSQVHIGDTLEYTLAVTVENSATRAVVTLTDTLGVGLAFGEVTNAGTFTCTAGNPLVCTLPVGTVPGNYSLAYTATVTADARDTVRNAVVGTSGDGQDPPECGVCETEHEVADKALLRITKTVATHNVNIGDLVRYTLTVENIGAANVTNATVIDTPPAGFSYVADSMAVADRDGAFTLNGSYPLRIGGLDINAGESATIVYLLRVGVGVKPGVHQNHAVAVDETDTPISNEVTAEVVLDNDPLLDDSLIFGTVFDDRDEDGWQDRADLSGVKVQGGFAPGAYVANSSTIDYGNGPQPLADASSPMLHGVDVGSIAARQSEADPVQAHRVTIRQRLASLDFDDSFVLTSAQGVSVRMVADGSTTVEKSGEAAKGLNNAAPTVQRTVSAVEGGYEVAYIITNEGIDERGIPGVRIASVEGLLIETDQYGRYHLADVQGGDWGHGRNFLLKVDPATLPAGSEFTTENPRVRRVTPGIPVRFDFGVKLPVQVLQGEQKVELELGEVIFAPDSAEVRDSYLPVIQQVADKVEQYHGGEVVIVANGETEALAFARAAAVRDVLQGQVGEQAKAGLSVVLRTDVAEPSSLVAGVDASGTLLGTVLFDTDKSAIRPEFNALLDAVAKRLEAMGGGVVVLTGHTDVRASHAYNVALGLRRATAVQQALAKRLSPEVRAKLRVESSNDPAAPVGTERK